MQELDNWSQCTKWWIYMHNLQNYANMLYWQFTAIGDELAIAQQLISDILTCFEADVAYWIGRLWRQRRGKRCPIETPNRGAPLGETRGAWSSTIAQPLQLETVQHCLSAVMRMWSFTDCVLVTLNDNNKYDRPDDVFLYALKVDVSAVCRER